MKKKIIWKSCQYGFGITAVVYVVWTYGEGIYRALQNPVQWVPLTLAVLICLSSVLLTFLRWHVLVRAQGLPFTRLNAVRLGLIGYFYSNFLPGTVTGDIFKATFIAWEQRRRTVAVATVLIDRAVGLLGLILLVFLLGTGFWIADNPVIHQVRTLQVVVLGAAAIVAASVVFWVLLGVLPERRARRFAARLRGRVPKVGRVLSEFWKAVWMYRCRGRSIALALAMAVVGHVGFVLTFYFAAQTFLSSDQPGQIPTLAGHFLIVPVGMTWQSVFPAPGGIGGGEAGYAWLYQLLGSPPDIGVLACFFGRMISWGLGFIGYLFYLRMRPALPVLRRKRWNLDLGSSNGECREGEEPSDRTVPIEPCPEP